MDGINGWKIGQVQKVCFVSWRRRLHVVCVCVCVVFRYLQADLEHFDLQDLKSEFDVILLEPPLEEYYRESGISHTERFWTWDDVSLHTNFILGRILRMDVSSCTAIVVLLQISHLYPAEGNTRSSEHSSGSTVHLSNLHVFIWHYFLGGLFTFQWGGLLISMSASHFWKHAWLVHWRQWIFQSCECEWLSIRALRLSMVYPALTRNELALAPTQTQS